MFPRVSILICWFIALRIVCAANEKSIPFWSKNVIFILCKSKRNFLIHFKQKNSEKFPLGFPLFRINLTNLFHFFISALKVEIDKLKSLWFCPFDDKPSYGTHTNIFHWRFQLFLVTMATSPLQNFLYIRTHTHTNGRRYQISRMKYNRIGCRWIDSKQRPTHQTKAAQKKRKENGVNFQED